MRLSRFFLAASLCTLSAVATAMPLVVSFVPHDSNSEVKAPGPKDQTGHFEFAFEDADKKAPPAQPGGWGLVNFPDHAGGKGPALLLPPQQGIDLETAFNGPDLTSPGASEVNAVTPSAEVPEPGSLALLLLSLSGLAAVRLSKRSRPRMPCA
jgi:hypothetical protein